MSHAVRGLEELDPAGKRVLCRVDFNVPFGDDGKITDDTRIRAALPTIERILTGGGRPVLMSHLGRPKGEVVANLRLSPVGMRLQELTGHPVRSLRESIGEEVEAAVAGAEPGTVTLLENVRFHAGETKGSPELAAAFARLGDVFVNDAFGTSHRDHASVCGVARLLPSFAGLLLERELAAFDRVLQDPARPLVAVLGGAKVSDKLPVIASLVERVDAILVGGGMAYTFLAAQGHSIGTSLVQHDQQDAVRANLARAEATGCRLLLPVDHVVGEAFAAETEARTVDEIPAGWMGLDIGPRTRELYGATIQSGRTVVWNGPMGVFEWESFRAGTEAVGRAVCDCEGYTVVGGGDSVAAIELFGWADEIDHVSTGGGASLELLEGKALPGIEALRARD